MSGEKATSPCSKFQANIFNKSKCQNCFKSRELHLLTDHGMEQAKPIYAGWLCLAPVGTDFDNPMQRSRKWQRRFFILYEDGSLSFALDELPSTLPQGTVNMNQCTDIADAEPRTSQRNALCIATPEQEIFIRGDNKEIINGWSEQLAVYLRTNKQNQKKKRKVEPVATQEPSPAKMAATDPSFPASQNNSESGPCGWWQEEQQQGRTPGETPMWTVPDSDPPGPEKTPAGNTSSYLSPASLDLLTSGNTDRNDQLAEPNNNNNESRDKRTTEQLLGLEATEKEQEVGTAVSRTGRSDTRSNRTEKLQSCGDSAQLSAPPPHRRAKSLDRRTSDTIMTPDLLNFKKGWMVKLDGNEKWKKYWFVLSTDSLRFYKDSIAEEASDLEGEIDLTKCFNVSEYQVQRNYGFQIHTPKGIFTLSAMTSGIRKNWIQALMKNVRPANAPDVASLPGHGPCSPPEVLPRPDVTQDSGDVSTDPKHRTVTERRREGRYKTFDWAEFRPPNKQRTKAPSCLELGDLERRRRREERRRRYESMLGFPLGWEVGGGQEAGGSARSLSPKSQQKVEEDIEECWKQVEKTAFRLDRSVSLLPDAKESEVEKLLDGYKTGVEDLKVQLEESERLRLDLEAQLRTAGFYQQQLDPPLSSNEKPLMSFEPQTSSVWLHDTEGNFQELEHLLPETEITPLLLSPASDSSFPQSDGQTVDLNVATINRQNQQVPSAETQINSSEFSSLILKEPAERDASLSCCVDQHGAPDQEVVRRLSLEVELLASQNEALNQRNQEMLNQLTEADREIERLKVELSSRYTEPHHLPEVEQLGRTSVEDLERKLSSRDQELLEAQTLITSLEENLREMEALLQLNVATETEEENQGYLLRCFEATEAKLTELERQLDQSELSCMELRTLNAELKEAEKLHREAAAEAEADARRLREELEEERLKDRGNNRCVSAEGRIRQVIDGMVVRLKALEKLLEVIEKVDFGWREEETVESRLRWEEEFLSLVLDRLKVKRSELSEEDAVEELLSEVIERMMVEKQILLLGHHLLSETSADERLKDLDIIWNIASETETEATAESTMFEFNDQLYEMGHFRGVAQVKISFLNRLTSSVGSSACDKLQLMADFHSSEHPWSGFIHSAATEAFLCCHLSRLQAEYKRQLEETKRISSVCSNCVNMREENRELRARWSKVEEKSSDVGTHLQDTDVELQEADEEAGGDADRLDSETEIVLELRRRVEELEEKLGIMEEEMKEELDGKMSSVQRQHEKEMEKLKVTCERGFASMEASHLKVEEELLRRHQREVERLLVERDRLLEEESAATATAIEAIKNAHRLELEREVQKRCQSESSAGNTHLEDVYRQHSEELASFQRELQVLSQQFSLKCLENGHLVQALDAERKALCQCQQENQDLRTRNQELSGHLAAEITRLCSLAKQDALPLSQGMDVYEMEITLRVKESEVQCLKQEITSLRDDLQSAQRDKRNATKKYKDMYTELSITRAKTERDLDELRENLRLAHDALHQTSL